MGHSVIYCDKCGTPVMEGRDDWCCDECGWYVKYCADGIVEEYFSVFDEVEQKRVIDKSKNLTKLVYKDEEEITLDDIEEVELFEIYPDTEVEVKNNPNSIDPWSLTRTKNNNMFTQHDKEISMNQGYFIFSYPTSHEVDLNKRTIKKKGTSSNSKGEAKWLMRVSTSDVYPATHILKKIK